MTSLTVHPIIGVVCNQCADPIPVPAERCLNPDCKKPAVYEPKDHITMMVSFDKETRRLKAESPLRDQVEDYYREGK